MCPTGRHFNLPACQVQPGVGPSLSCASCGSHRTGRNNAQVRFHRTRTTQPGSTGWQRRPLRLRPLRPRPSSRPLRSHRAAPIVRGETEWAVGTGNESGRRPPPIANFQLTICNPLRTSARSSFGISSSSSTCEVWPAPFAAPRTPRIWAPITRTRNIPEIRGQEVVDTRKRTLYALDMRARP